MKKRWRVNYDTFQRQKSHAFKGIGEKLNPTIYQVRFMKLDEPIRFEPFPELERDLGDCGHATQLCTNTTEKSLKRSS